MFLEKSDLYVFCDGSFDPQSKRGVAAVLLVPADDWEKPGLDYAVQTKEVTSKSNGLTETPPCSLGPPRAGHYVGVPGGVMTLPTWVDFSSIDTLDNYDLAIHVSSGRKSIVTQTLPPEILCAVLRCVLQSDDITRRQARWIGDAVAVLNCA